MADQPQRLNAWRVAALAAAPCIAAAVGLWMLGAQGSAAPAGAATEQSMIVARRPFQAMMGFTGKIVPAETIGIVAPFDGTITALGFSYGDRVQEGQLLLSLDRSEVAEARNEAEANYLKASDAARGVAEWSTGPEVMRARRALESARMDLEHGQRSLAETQRLLDKGLVPRTEYEMALQQQRTQKMAVAAAADDLDAALDRGNGATRRTAALDLENARLRLARLDDRMARARILAPGDGIVVRPPQGSDTHANTLSIGSRLSRDQLIGLIAPSGGFGVAFELEEADINQLAPGQKVTVTGAGFGGMALAGRIRNVAGEAAPAAGGAAGKAVFAATALLDPLTVEQARHVRIGMTAQVQVVTREIPAAIVVPPQAVQGASPDAFVMVRPPGSAAPRRAPVRIGHADASGIEITSGLRPGDRIIWEVPGQ